MMWLDERKENTEYQSFFVFCYILILKLMQPELYFNKSIVK